MVTTSGPDVEREAEQKVALLEAPEAKGEQEKAPWAPGVSIVFMIVIFAFLIRGAYPIMAGMSKSGHGGKHAIEYSLAWLLCLNSLVKLVMFSCALPFQVCIRDCRRFCSFFLSRWGKYIYIPHSRTRWIPRVRPMCYLHVGCTYVPGAYGAYHHGTIPAHREEEGCRDIGRSQNAILGSLPPKRATTLTLPVAHP